MRAWQGQRARVLYEALRRFRTFKLHLSPILAEWGLIDPVVERNRVLVEEALFNTILAFQHIFAHRSLIIVLPIPEDYPLFEKHPHLLVSCRMLDCVSIHVEGFQIPERVKRDLAGTVSSDLFNDCFRLEDRVTDIIPDRRIEWPSVAIEKLQHITTHCDEAATIQARREYLRRMLRKMNNFHRRMIADSIGSLHHTRTAFEKLGVDKAEIDELLPSEGIINKTEFRW